MSRWETRFMFWCAIGTFAPLVVSQYIGSAMAFYCAFFWLKEQLEAKS